jgi:hypothetical protein
MSVESVAETIGRSKPLEIRYYWDRLHAWLQYPLTKKERDYIESHCGGNCDFGRQPARFDPRRYLQLIQLLQPDPEALHFVAGREDALINYVEAARDSLFTSPMPASRWQRAFQLGFLQPYHRGSMQVKTYPNEGFTTRKVRSGMRTKGTWFALYADELDRFTAQPCFHFESRHMGLDYVRRIGIYDPTDLLTFDFAAHFANVMVLYDLDLERLGRYHDNKCNNLRRQNAKVRYVNLDYRLGRILWNRHARHPDCPRQPAEYSYKFPKYSLQHFVDSYGRGPYLSDPVPIYVI